MRKIKLSPSKVETFRKYFKEEMNGLITEDKVVESIMGTTPWKPAMEFGSAFHKVLEVDARQFFDVKKGVYIVRDEGMPGDVILTQADVDVANKYRLTYPNMIHEIWGVYRTQILDYDISLNLRIDGQDGVVVHEKKTTNHFYGYEGYERSLQWRFYAMVTECKIVQYDIFVVTDGKGGRKIEYIKPFQLIPYRGMKEDTDSWILNLIRFCDSKGLMDYIIPAAKDEPLFRTA